MNPFRELRAVFAPYELAAGAIVIQIVFIATGLGLLLSGRQPAAILAFLPAVAVSMFANFAVHCPRCGKPPMRYYMTAWGEERGGEPMGRRAWPERRCSSCGTTLDIL